MWKDKLTNLQSNFKITQRGGALLPVAENKKKSYQTMQNNYEAFKVRDRQSSINQYDMAKKMIDAPKRADILKRSNTTDRARPPSTIAHKRAKTTLHVQDGDIKNVIHGVIDDNNNYGQLNATQERKNHMISSLEGILSDQDSIAEVVP